MKANKLHTSKSFFYYAFVILEISIIVILLEKMYENVFIKQNQISVMPINRSQTQFPKIDGLKYYYEPKPNTVETFQMSWLPHTVYNITNADTLYDTKNYSIKKDKGVFRIIALGDSWTEGAYVDTEKNHPTLLANILNTQFHCSNIKKFAVLNLGVRGYDPEYELARYKIRGQKYDPDLVLWFISKGDFNEIIEDSMPLMEKYRFDNGLSQQMRKSDP